MKTEMSLYEEKILASVCRESFYEFFREFWGQIIHEPPVLNWHIRFLCEELQKIAEKVFLGETKDYDLVINVPPGSTKSTVCSQMFPAWVWTRMPHAQLIHVSYAYAVALKDSLRCRDIVQSELYQRCFGLELREDENTKGLYTNTQKGFRLSVGMGGSITGQHGHFLIIDDPINPEEAFSESELRTANRWMQTTLPTRKVDKAVTPTVLIQQRLHQADPSGEMIEKSKEKGVRHINLPGEITEHVSPVEIREKYIDGLLDPVRLSRTVLENMKQELGEYAYASQILQHPVPLGGGMFKTDKFNVILDPPAGEIVRKVRSWDKAGTKDGGAWSVGTLMGADKVGRYWILDVVRGQWGSTEREATIVKTAQEDGESVEILLEIEGGSGGKESGENTVRRLAGYRIHTFHPTGDKEARAYPYSSQVGAGNVFVLQRHWTRAFLEEHRFFPHSKYKDQVDCTSAAFNRLAKEKKRIGAMARK